MRVVAVDLFCGIGGLTKGLTLAGIDVVAGIDIDESCAFVYEANNNSKFICGDVSKFDQKTLHDLYPSDSIKILVGCARVSHSQSILASTEKMGIRMINGNYYLRLAI